MKGIKCDKPRYRGREMTGWRRRRREQREQKRRKQRIRQKY